MVRKSTGIRAAGIRTRLTVVAWTRPAVAARTRLTVAARTRLTVAALVGAALLSGCGGDHSGGRGDGALRLRDTPSRSPSPSPHKGARPRPKPPRAQVSREIAHAAESGGKAVNLTIDDGPDPAWTPQVLKILKDNHAKAVFCVIGPQAKAHPDLVKRIVAEGHRLCDHSVSHNSAMAQRPHAYQKEQILTAAAQITQASGGTRPDYYRAPGGAFTPYSRHIAAAAGMRPLGWNVDSEDFARPGVGAILHTVKDELGNGPTLLFHDGGGDRSQTVEALQELLPWLRQHGYAFSFPVR